VEGEEEEASDTVTEEEDAPDLTERGEDGALDTARTATLEVERADTAAGDETALDIT
jgi:hypothetical protein